MFAGVKLFPVIDLGVSQIYLNEAKLVNIRKWLNPTDLSGFVPLTVHDFGNGKLTLTDGHSRAFLAYVLGIQQVPVVYDTDEMVTSYTGRLLYENDIAWCERFRIYSVRDLKDRIVSDAEYKDLWIGRCDKAYNLLTQTTAVQRQKLQLLCPALHLYGANEDMTLLFFENDEGRITTLRNNAIL